MNSENIDILNMSNLCGEKKHTIYLVSSLFCTKVQWNFFPDELRFNGRRLTNMKNRQLVMTIAPKNIT